jgi:hypothetical protein
MKIVIGFIRGSLADSLLPTILFIYVLIYLGKEYLMSTFKPLFLTIITIGSLNLISCAEKQAPHLGETITQAETLDGGIKVTQADTREVLANGKIAGADVTLIESEASVVKIDKKNRILSIKTASGDLNELKAGPEIRNFSQIKVGDKIKVEYLLSVQFEVRKPTAEELAADGTTNEVLAKSKLGEKPAGGIGQGSINIAKVEAIDKVAQTVTLREVSSNTITQVKAKYPENLSYIKVGDSVVIKTLEALAVGIEKVK